MNPQPNSTQHPEVIECMKKYDNALVSLNDYREHRKGPIDDFGTISYENVLISHVREAHKQLVYWCGHYGIVLPYNFDNPRIIMTETNFGVTDGTDILHL